MIRCQPALGTFVEIVVQDAFDVSQSHFYDVAFSRAFQAIHQVEKSMSLFLPGSDLSLLNQGAALDHPIKIDQDLWKVLELAKELYQISDGLFDVCTSRVLVDQGLRPSYGRNQTYNDSEWGSIADLELLDEFRVKIYQPIYLDLGGIAKGYAVDEAVLALQGFGVESGSVNAGGDLRVFGAKLQEVYRRSERYPHDPIYLGSLSDGSIATSSDYFVSDVKRGIRGHLINPITKKPIETSQSFSVIAPRCVHADALTKIYAITQNPNHPAFDLYQAKALEYV